MSCERIEELLAEQRDALPQELSRSSTLREHAESCAVCRAVVAEHRDVRRALSPLEAVRPGTLPSKRGGPRLAAAAAALFVVGLGIILFSADRNPAQVQKLDPRWLAPEEVLRSEGLRTPRPAEVFRTTTGTIGLVLVGDTSSLLISKDGKAPWREVPLPPGTPSRPLVSVDQVTFLMTGSDDEPLWQITVEISGNQTAHKTPVGRGPRPAGRAPYLLGRGNDRYALLAAEGQGGGFHLSRSEDGGKTWSEFQQIPGEFDVYRPYVPFVVTSRGLHFFPDSRSGMLHKLSVDKGRTWTDERAPVLPGRAANPTWALGAAQGEDIHLVTAAHQNFYHLASRDAGRTWEKERFLARLDVDGIFPQMTVAGDVVAFSMLSPTPGKAQAWLFLSRDGGRQWKREEFNAGVGGNCQHVTLWAERDGTLWSAFETSGVQARPGLRYLLLREYAGPPPPTKPLDAAGRKRVAMLIARLGDDASRERDAATASLLQLGEAARPLLQEAMAVSSDPEAQLRIRELLRKMELSEPSSVNASDWWQGTER
jgi:hypothetical protein